MVKMVVGIDPTGTVVLSDGTSIMLKPEDIHTYGLAVGDSAFLSEETITFARPLLCKAVVSRNSGDIVWGTERAPSQNVSTHPYFSKRL